MSAKTNDTVLLALGGLAVLGTAAWAFLQQSDIAAFRAPSVAPSSGAAYEPSVLKISPPESSHWVDAPSQTAGPKWIYDVFTPPKIYYNTQTKQFTVVPPEPVVGPDPTKVTVDPTLPPAFGLELAKVEQPLFRLQLVGYVGEGANARGTFENQLTKQVVFGAAGKKLADLNLEITKFTSERRRTKIAGGTEIVETVATATVRDTVTGAETALDVKTRTPEGPLAVTFKLSDGTERTAKAGESIVVGDATFKVGDLTLFPPSAVVTKEQASAAPETKTLVVPPPPPPPAPVDPNAAPVEMPGGVPAPAKPGAPGAFPGF